MGGTDEFRCSEWRIAMPSDLSPTSAIRSAEEEKGRHLYLRDPRRVVYGHGPVVRVYILG